MLLNTNTLSVHSIFFYLFTIISLVGCGGGGGGGSSSAPVITLDALSLNNVSSTLNVGDKFQLAVTGSYSDSSTQDITSQISWAIDDNSILSISNSGLVEALSAGTTTVTASFEGESVQQSISVKALTDLSISPNSLTLAINSAQQLSVTGRYTDNSTENVGASVVWSSSNDAIATVSGLGEVQAVAAGTANITATSGSVNSTISVTVLPDLISLSLTNVSTALRVSETFQLTVTGNYSDASTQDLTSQANWAVADESVLGISSSGLVTALSAGTTNVTASFGGLSIQQSISVKALDNLTISPSSLTLAINSAQQLSVTGRYTDNSTENVGASVVWSSSNDAIATVSGLGEVQAVAAGTANITATSGSVNSTISVTVLPDLISLSLTNVSTALRVSETFQLTVTGNYSDASTQDLTSQVSWSSSDSSVVSISSAGLIEGLSLGSANVTASLGSLTVQETVFVAILVDLSISPNSLILAIDSAQQLSVTGRYTDNSTEDVTGLVIWSSSDAAVADVSSSGEVNAIAEGSTSISASIDSISTTLNVVVSPATLESIVVSSPVAQVATGLTVQLSAKGIYSDGTEQIISDEVVWSVSDISKASIDSETGLLSAIQAGSITVKAAKGANNGEFSLTISPATLSEISITPASIALAEGTTENLSVTAIFSDNSKQDVSDQVAWANADDSIATIEQNGFTVNALTKGTTTFTASLSGQSAGVSVNVTDAELVSLTISPANTTIPLGLSAQFSAQGTYTDGSVQDLTSEVTWLSDDESVVVVSNAESFNGLASSVALGSSAISAILGTVQQQTTITIENAVLNSIDIQPANQTIANGTDAQVAAYGYYSDGSQIDLSAQVIWNASQPALVDLSSIAQGVVRSLGQGNVLLSAELQGISGIANIEISSASLQSISIEAVQTSLPNGMNQSLIARGSYSDTSTKDISAQVTWQSSDVSILTVGNSANDSGLVRATDVGQSTITASLGSVFGQITIDVTNAVLTGLQISSSASQLNETATASALAIATYSDASTQDVTAQVNWSSDELSIASIGNSASDKGLIKALSVGTANISASLNGISSNIFALQVTLDPNLPRALNLSIQPNIILNDNNDASQVSFTLVPAGQNGVIADGTPVTLTITEGNSVRVETLPTTNGSVNYSLQSSYNGFISLSASSGDLSANSGLVATDDFTDAITAQGKARSLYENNTLRAGSKFIMLLRNISNRVFKVDQIEIFYFDPNDGNARTDFPESPLVDSASTSDGYLIGGELTFIGYELDNDVEASVYAIVYSFTDEATSTAFGLNAVFDFDQ